VLFRSRRRARCFGLQSLTSTLTVNSHDLSDGLPSRDLYAAVQGPNQTLWLATDNGLASCRRQGEGFELRRIGPEQGLPDEIVTALSLDPKGGGLWLGFHRGSYAAYDPLTQRWSEGADLGVPLEQALADQPRRWLLTEAGQLFAVQRGQPHLQSIPRLEH
jgi:ligand-binding sensor domain-containing protein